MVIGPLNIPSIVIFTLPIVILPMAVVPLAFKLCTPSPSLVLTRYTCFEEENFFDETSLTDFAIRFCPVLVK